MSIESQQDLLKDMTDNTNEIDTNKFDNYHN